MLRLPYPCFAVFRIKHTHTHTHTCMHTHKQLYIYFIENCIKSVNVLFLVWHIYLELALIDLQLSNNRLRLAVMKTIHKLGLLVLA